MNWLWESPWTILIGGAAIEAALLVALVRTGRGTLLAAVAGVGLLTTALFVAERMVVTEREEVEATLDDLAAALERNNLPAVLEFIDPASADVRALAERRLPDVVIGRAHVGSDLAIQLNERAQPPTAEARFTGTFEFKLVRGALPHDKFVRRFRVAFSKTGGRWRITGVEESSLQRQ